MTDTCSRMKLLMICCLKTCSEDCFLVAAEGNFDSKGLGIRAQKKLAGKLASKKIAKQFIDDTSGRLLDNLYKAAKEFYDKKTAEKAIKNLIKTVIKIGILYRNDQFSANEIRIAENFKKKFRTIAMTIVSFYEVDFTFDRSFLTKNLLECSAMLKQLIERHLTEKSAQRVDNVFGTLAGGDFLEAMFSADEKYREHLRKITTDLSKLLEDGVL